ncbi:MAG: hypothetical protein LAT68_10535 [Cyclobacteriaceae bacterium]|nr:hypothetical protein [Cyclobacteriaceae bacterium]MCH8516752.1 hypothetical protein [Cyclobacteriaceae bacterium]
MVNINLPVFIHSLSFTALLVALLLICACGSLPPEPVNFQDVGLTRYTEDGRQSMSFMLNDLDPIRTRGGLIVNRTITPDQRDSLTTMEFLLSDDNGNENLLFETLYLPLAVEPMESINDFHALEGQSIDLSMSPAFIVQGDQYMISSFGNLSFRKVVVLSNDRVLIAGTFGIAFDSKDAELPVTSITYGRFDFVFSFFEGSRGFMIKSQGVEENEMDDQSEEED